MTSASEAKKAYIENRSKWNERYQIKPLSLGCVKIKGPFVKYHNPFTVSDNIETDNLVIKGLTEVVFEEVIEIFEKNEGCNVIMTAYKTYQTPNYKPGFQPGLDDRVWIYPYGKISSRELKNNNFSPSELETIIKNLSEE